jgi:F-type H+-transporting ATPase subunit epsilon
MATDAAKQINFELVSPEAKLISAPVKMAVIPGEEGELGVGAGHSSFIVSLKPGVVKLYTNDNSEEPKKIFITGGFADITNTNCTVLAEMAIPVDQIDAAKAEQDVKDLKEDLNAATDADRSRITRRLNLAKARLAAATGRLVL